MTRDIFISYSRWNLDKVKAIKEDIEKATGVDCWMDLNAIESGSSQFTQDIVDGINGCRVFLFMLSKESQVSEFALRELNLAVKKAKTDTQKHVVIVNLDGCEMTDEFYLMYGLSDLIMWKDKPQRDKLIRDLTRWHDIQIKSEKSVPKSPNISQRIKRFWISSPAYIKWTSIFILLITICASLWYAFRQPTPEEIEGYYQLAEDHFYGQNGKQENEEEAIKWYLKAAKYGHVEAQYELGYCYRYGSGVFENHAEAFKWYYKAAEQGHIKAQYSVGYCYLNKYGVAKDYKEAFKWFLKAAEQGHSGAQCYLGDLYYNGWGVSKDYSKAVKWYLKSAEQGITIAQRMLGDCYYEGLGVKQDYTKASMWYRKAAEYGDYKAKIMIEKLEEAGY